ncbi:hypothetical protein BX666DRAFT_1442960 [Dichotomocladium elegans]|nr:hypothetical protein BX666DRAFT_1442960 [Dichotomocladium elegans]
MEDAPHYSLRSLTANSSSGVLGLSLNKRGPSFRKASPPIQQTGRVVALPPLNLTASTTTSPESPSSESAHTDNSSSNHRIMNKGDEVDALLQRTRRPSSSSSSIPPPVIDSCKTLLFAATTLQMTVRRCFLPDIDTHSIAMALAKTKTSADRLMQALDLVDNRQPSPDLLRAAAGIIRQLKDLCSGIQQSPLLANLDAKFGRYLLASVHTTTVDIKDCWETLRLSSTTTTPKQQQLQQQQRPGILRSRSHSDHLLATPSPAASPVSPITDNRSQLYIYLKLSVTHSIHVSYLLKQSIDETISNGDGDGTVSPSLSKKLQELGKLSLRIADMAVRLDKGLSDIATKESAISRKEFWQETNEYLKVVVTVMNLVRLTSTQEDFSWPKAVKQSCLQVTRVTAEVAKLWNSCSAFVEEGYYLGSKKDDSPTPAVACDTPSNRDSPSSSSIASSLSEHMT